MAVLKVLLVEDHQEWQDILLERLNRALQDAGRANDSKIRVVAKFEEAWEALNEEGPWHLLVTDIDLGSSPEAKQKLGKQLAQYASDLQVPTIVVSGTEVLTRQEVRDLLMKYGAIDFFSKPDFDRDEFITKVQHVLQTLEPPQDPVSINDLCRRALIIGSATPSTTVPGKSTAAPEEKGVTGYHQKRNGPAQSVSHYDFFIAYASPNRQQAQNLSWFLQDESWEVFLDVECLAPGAPWPNALREALEASRVIVVLVSAHTDHAFYQQEEIVRAMQLARDKPEAYTVIPVILDKLPQGAVCMPYGMSSLQAPDATRSGGLKRVAAELAAWLDAH
jgi:CheY-like chemotaxis protein